MIYSTEVQNMCPVAKGAFRKKPYKERNVRT